MNEPKNLLIVRTDRIGDVVLSLPMASIIKKHYPGCKVSFLIRNYTKSLVVNHPAVDEVIILDENNSKPLTSSNINRIKKYNFDTVILVYPTFILSLVIFLTGIKKRIGTGYRWYSLLFTDKVYTHRKYASKHELEFNIELLKKINIKENVSKEKISFNLPIRKESEQLVNKVLIDAGFDNNKPVIIFHPGSGGSAVDLPVEKFKELVEKTDRTEKFNVIITGSKSEKELCENIKSSENVFNFAGLFELPELVALINRTDIFVANSTGPLHIAAALGKFIVGFYPKIQACSVERWGPYSAKGFTFKPNIECTNCSREQCERLNCMNSINIEEVLEKIELIHKIIQNGGEINV